MMSILSIKSMVWLPGTRNGAYGSNGAYGEPRLPRMRDGLLKRRPSRTAGSGSSRERDAGKLFENYI